MHPLTFLFDGSFAYAFGWTLIHSLWQGLLIAAALGLTLRIVRPQSANLRYLFGLTALGICVVASATTFLHYWQDSKGALEVIRAAHHPIELVYSGQWWETVYGNINQSINLLLLLWFAGFLFQLVRYISDFWGAMSLRQEGCTSISGEWTRRFLTLSQTMGIARPVAVRLSRRVNSACVIGHLKPIVLLPVGLLTSMTVDEVEAIVLHELAHIKRNDYLVNAVQCFIKLMYFFNPAILWISGVVDRERENACDDMAVRHCQSATVYARSLARIAAMDTDSAGVLAARKRGYKLLPRIKRLFLPANGAAHSLEKITAAAGMLVLLMAMNVSAADVRFSRQQNTQTDTEIVTEVNRAEDAAAIKTAPNDPRDADASANWAGNMPASAPAAVSMPAAATSPTPASAALDYALQNMERNAASIPDSMPANEIAGFNQPFAAAPAQDREPVTLAEADTGRKTDARGSSSPSLEAIPTTDFDELYVVSDAKLPVTKKIYIDDVESAFAKVWLKRFRGKTSHAYRSTILQDYAAGFKDQLVDSFENAGWMVSQKPGSDTLRLNARLFDVYIVEPETSGSRQTLVAMSGQAAIELIFKTPEGEDFMKIVDYRNTPSSVNNPILANRASNYHYFSQLMSDWAGAARSYLDSVMEIVRKQAG